ncbi:hypothetical protein QQP08_018275 [Theobroma cacao]|nr:hypothetical protein QQP08_018275 [Theobroma cacao]
MNLTQFGMGQYNGRVLFIVQTGTMGRRVEVGCNGATNRNCWLLQPIVRINCCDNNHRLQDRSHWPIGSVVGGDSLPPQPTKQLTFLTSLTVVGCLRNLLLHAYKFVNFEAPYKPNSVLAFFKNHGFSKTQIATISKRQPVLLLYDVETILLSKVEFFYS